MGKRKLTPTDREEIVYLSENENATISDLSRWFRVSRATIRFVLHPELEEKNRAAAKERQRRVRTSEQSN